jgi:hypothetical protein
MLKATISKATPTKDHVLYRSKFVMHSSTKLHLINKLNSNREHAHFECCGFEPWSGQTKDYKMGGHFNIGHYYVLHMHLSNFLQYLIDSIGGIMVSVLALSVVDRGFEPWSGQTKDYKTGICCFSAIKHAALRRKSKDWLAQNQNNVSEWSNMSTHRLLFQLVSII